MKYARVLLEHCPEQTTKLFIDYYTGQFQPRRESDQPKEVQPQAIAGAVQNLAALIPLPRINLTRPGNPPPEQIKPAANELQEQEQAEPAVKYNIPKPRTAFSSFVDHPQEFISFLEALIKQEGLKDEDKVDLYTTLFEMYLDTASRKKDLSEKQDWEFKAKSLIQGKDVSYPKNQHFTSHHHFSWNQKPTCILDTCFYIRCIATIRSIKLSRRDNFSSRKGRS